ncbi:MAG TPA: glycosyl hydrolase family 28-related protein [Tepidisphaeraceae bacterium]|nr:glycosyl hydrolase family 28-related protein [Tepidisphaeraceae bacterium]
MQGSGLGPSVTVEVARLDDTGSPSGSEPGWRTVPVLQPTDRSLKFVLPADWKMGVFACRIQVGAQQGERLLLNAPDPWWIQGDEGASATPGGWLRVLGKSLEIGGTPKVRLVPASGPALELGPIAASMYALKFQLPPDLRAGDYSVAVHNGAGGPAGWKEAGTIRIESTTEKTSPVFSVLETYGADAPAEMRKTLIKYNQPLDRTEGVQSALKKAKDAGGGTVFFPAGRYLIKGPIAVPDHTRLKGEGEGLVTIWWGAGHFNLDGGGSQGRALVDEPKPPHTLISGHDFAIEDMSLYLPFRYEEGISCEARFRMTRTRVRVDHYWLVQGRGGGTVARLGNNFQVTDCDILAKGDALVPGTDGLIARNRILSNKSNTPMGGAQNVVIEENEFVGMDPTAYQNISGVGRNIYYAHNRQQNLYAHQADYSFTFDAGTGAYLGGIVQDGARLTLAADPVFPKWAQENAKLWTKACVCILDGQGAGQWRDVIEHHGRSWTLSRPFDPAPDATSVASIIAFNGRVLAIGNRFEDANWVNAGYGTSIDVIYAENELARCAEMMNYGLFTHDSYQPSWHVQYFDNRITEGQTKEASTGNAHKTSYTFPLTSGAVHRRQTFAADNSGSIVIGGNLTDAIVEHCTLKNPASAIRADGNPRGVLFRENSFKAAPHGRYEGGGLKDVLILPAP